MNANREYIKIEQPELDSSSCIFRISREGNSITVKFSSHGHAFKWVSVHFSDLTINQGLMMCHKGYIYLNDIATNYFRYGLIIYNIENDKMLPMFIQSITLYRK